MKFKVHPAIGIARLGNSPTDFFIGPETIDEPLPPPGGHKDAECRIKRQAARFRVFKYNDAGKVVGELTRLPTPILPGPLNSPTERRRPV